MKKKILFCIDSLGGGGAEKVLLDILKNIDKEKYDIDVFLTFYSGIYIAEVEKAIGKKVLSFIKEKKCGENSNIFFKRLESLKLRLKCKIAFDYPVLIPALFFKKYDIEIAFLEGRTTKLVSKTFLSKRKIAWVHIDLLKYKLLDRKVLEEVYTKFYKIICVSNSVQESIKQIVPNISTKTEVIYNLIDREEIVKKAELVNVRYDKRVINIVSVGRLVNQKGYDILLEAHKELIKEGFEYNLYILGEGGKRRELEKYIDDNNLKKNTFLLGFKQNPYPYIKAADFFVSSSRYEGYPLVLCEAVCLGKPIIATRCTGPTEILENGKYGILVEVENVNDLKEKIKILILNKKLRKKYQKLSISRREVFNIKKRIKQIEGVLDE